MKPEGIILSGGPASIYEKGSPEVDPGIFDLGIPVLGICYGMQFMVNALGGKVCPGRKNGNTVLPDLSIRDDGGIFQDIEKETQCWMSHGDSIVQPAGGISDHGLDRQYARRGGGRPKEAILRLQFHPEVVHTPEGKKMLENFLFRVCGCKKSWTMKSFARDAVEEIRAQVGDGKVILGLSGGVDSSVAALLLHQAIGDQLTCVFVDNGVLGKERRKRSRMSSKSIST